MMYKAHGLYLNIACTSYCVEINLWNQPYINWTCTTDEQNILLPVSTLHGCHPQAKTDQDYIQFQGHQVKVAQTPWWRHLWSAETCRRRFCVCYVSAIVTWISVETNGFHCLDILREPFFMFCYSDRMRFCLLNCTKRRLYVGSRGGGWRWEWMRGKETDKLLWMERVCEVYRPLCRRPSLFISRLSTSWTS
jgi:hypothetical protein